MTDRKPNEGWLKPGREPHTWTGLIDIDGKPRWVNVYEVLTKGKESFRKVIVKPAEPRPAASRVSPRRDLDD